MLSLAVVALAASAMAVPMPAPTPAPDLNKAKAAKRATSCTFSGSDGYSLASVSQKDCATIVLSALTVPSGVTLDLSDLEDDTTVIFEGETSWEYAEWDGPLLQIEGTSITIEGASGAYLNGNGADWWDGEGSDGGVTKPKFFYAHDLTDSTITNLYIYNTPVQAVSIDNADGLTITDMTINNEAGASLGANTDGFDIGDSTNVVITGAEVYNQDDCVAINSGTEITVENSICSGGHGLSIGSVGGRDDNTVETVTFYNNEVKSSVNGIRIKATEGDTGSISGVTYQEITLTDISKYGILIEQNYDGGDLDGGTPSSGIPITDLTLDNISGTDGVESGGYNIVIACGSDACSDWTWTDVDVTGGSTYSDCTNVPSGISC
ncbi:family 28 glycoside hydrolase [Cryphonectria parasitica EP155]|uniref:endo-polygalacturonase n=1 Tax=Cryphonectria parasitica (strain ATCC 38755 / EP155) TaxID=660469 RepID=A0A9P4YD77_CRYP1|nr:family 28 glycoside hydrolase [Cryphonectria parasitica EP155]KAF3770905.1 family 28 glycoside hydrolase [Cryphonectria parasitica EP155]